MKNNLKKILLVNVNWLGDVIFSSPVFMALKQAYPQATVVCMAVPRVGEILKFIPGIDEVLTLDEGRMKWHPWQWLIFLVKLRQQKFDAVFLLHGSKTRARLMKWAGIPIRVGYERKGRKKYLTHVVPAHDGKIHRSDIYINVIKFFGVEVKNTTNCLCVSQEVAHQVDEILRCFGVLPHERIIVIHVGGNWPLKVWPENNFSLLIERLMKDSLGKVVICGSETDWPTIERIVKSLVDKPVILAGHTNLSQLMGVMARADVMISSDSGPLHVANSVGTDVVGIFGPTRPELTAPRGLGKSIILQKEIGCNKDACYNLDCPDNVCMKAVSVEEVYEAIRQIKSS